MSLGVRQALQIPPDHFRYDRPLVSMDGFSHELDQSRVYSRKEKEDLAKLFISLCELMVPLTEVIMLVYPQCEGVLCEDLENGLTISNKIQQCRILLSRWFEKACISRGKFLEGSVTVSAYAKTLDVFY